MPVSIAFIGFGEAAQLMSSGLSREPGVARLSAYDIRLEDPAAAVALQETARACEFLQKVPPTCYTPCRII